MMPAHQRIRSSGLLRSRVWFRASLKALHRKALLRQYQRSKCAAGTAADYDGSLVVALRLSGGAGMLNCCHRGAGMHNAGAAAAAAVDSCAPAAVTAARMSGQVVKLNNPTAAAGSWLTTRLMGGDGAVSCGHQHGRRGQPAELVQWQGSSRLRS